ncbi:DsrE family protein [Aliiroseovarius sp. KMU-50]|uniref:DsrE family protein n=1 Tax=Aliiroseovarius salicola TaxID=3009082 RepID=A0ABT4VX80_9RHOB|nr:DsrE family protein [Aliiroseovarius sp. KMU-50]MDA5092842.1 DsrE family protein [Aliiroseovarius sp. KMU-50]
MSYLVNNCWGDNDLERATVPFILACAAANRGEARMFLTCDALNLVVRGGAEGLTASGYSPIKDLIDEFVEKDGRIYVCKVCAGVMNITQDDLIEGAMIGTAPDMMDYLETGAKMLA